MLALETASLVRVEVVAIGTVRLTGSIRSIVDKVLLTLVTGGRI